MEKCNGNVNILGPTDKPKKIRPSSSRSEIHLVPDASKIIRPLSGQNLPFSLITDPQIFSRSARTEEVQRTTLQSRAQSRPKSSTLKRSGSVGSRSAFFESYGERTWVKENLNKADIRPVSKIKLERFYSNLVHIKEEEKILKDNIHNHQIVQEETLRNSKWNLMGRRNIEKAFESTVNASINSHRAMSALVSERENNKGLRPSSSSGEVKALHPNINTLLNFLKESNENKKPKDSVVLDKREISAYASRDFHSNSMVQGQYSTITDLLSSTGRDSRPSRMDDVSIVNRNHLRSSRGNKSRAHKEERNGDNKERADEPTAVEHLGSTFVRYSQIIMNMASGGCDIPEVNDEKTILEEVQGKFSKLKEFVGPETESPKRRASTIHQRPSSAKKKVKVIPFSKLFSVLKDKPEKIAQGEKALVITKIRSENGSEISRQVSPAKTIERESQTSRCIQQKIMEPVPFLNVQGHKFLETGENPKLVKRAYSNLKIRNLKSAEGDRTSYQSSVSYRESFVNDSSQVQVPFYKSHGNRKRSVSERQNRSGVKEQIQNISTVGQNQDNTNQISAVS